MVQNANIDQLAGLLHHFGQCLVRPAGLSFVARMIVCEDNRCCIEFQRTSNNLSRIDTRLGDRADEHDFERDELELGVQEHDTELLALFVSDLHAKEVLHHTKVTVHGLADNGFFEYRFGRLQNELFAKLLANLGDCVHGFKRLQRWKNCPLGRVLHRQKMGLGLLVSPPCKIDEPVDDHGQGEDHQHVDPVHRNRVREDQRKQETDQKRTQDPKRFVEQCLHGIFL